MLHVNRLQNFAQGRRIWNDDLRSLQGQIDALRMMYGNIGPFVISGCELALVGGTIYSMSEGLVFLNGKVCYVPAQPSLDLTASLIGVEIRETAEVGVSSRVYDLGGGTQNAMLEVQVEVVSSSIPGSGEALLVTPVLPGRRMRMLEDAIKDNVYLPGMFMNHVGPLDLSNPDPDLRDFAASGVGQNRYRGWLLDTGIFGGGEGRFLVGYDPNNPDYDTVGATGGAAEVQLTAEQSGLPAHAHPLTGGTVSNPGGTGTVASGTQLFNNQTQTQASVAQDAAQAHENRPPFRVVYRMRWLGYGGVFRSA